MDPTKYALVEDEQRFVVPRLPRDASAPRVIEDRYLNGTRLRLRRVTGDDGIVKKLGHKVPVDDKGPSAVWHTTFYVDEAEFESLSTLPARVLLKRRWLVAGGGCADEFLGKLEGLVLVEGPRPFTAAPPAIEVTDDERFCGGSLASLDADGAALLLADARRMAT